MEVAAHFESDDDYNEGGEHEAGGSDSETSEGGSRRPIFIRRPCGRGPNGKEWDTSIGAWVRAKHGRGCRVELVGHGSVGRTGS